MKSKTLNFIGWF